MHLHTWALKHGVSLDALKELTDIVLPPLELPPASVTTEAGVQNLIRLEASKIGAMLWRNNVGALKDERGVPLRYGLANDSSAMNKVFKSSDLIGIKPVKITMAMVGLTIGQFTAREVKAPSWSYKATNHEKAQKAFIDFVNARGGDACFVNGTGSFDRD